MLNTTSNNMSALVTEGFDLSQLNFPDTSHPNQLNLKCNFDDRQSKFY
jgi:hypothetical protein